MSRSIRYPRRTLIRTFFRLLVRTILALLAKTHIANKHKFPQSGPLIVVGNHTGAMEVVLMGAYVPKPVEFMGAMDIPWNGLIGVLIELYGQIPVYRGTTSKDTLRLGVDVLEQGGILGIFPEGGFWEPGKQKAQIGAAWFSYMTQTPILPIGFGDTRGKMAAIFKFQRPSFEMNVGDVLPPVQLDKSMSKKDALQKAADDIMDAVWDLVPEDIRLVKERDPDDEVFTTQIKIFDQAGQEVPIPPELALTDGSWISRFAHRPNLIDTIREFTAVPVQVLKEFHLKPSAKEIHHAVQSLLDYIETENPHYFTYRYGHQDGKAFHHSFHQFRDLLQWAIDNLYQIEAELHYAFTDLHTGERKLLRSPQNVAQW